MPTLKGTEVPLSCVQWFLYLMLLWHVVSFGQKAGVTAAQRLPRRDSCDE